MDLSAPQVLQGLIEVRGLGIVHVPFVGAARLVLVADLVAAGVIERLPEPADPATICGIEIPRMLVAPFEGSAPIKLLLALQAATAA